jgi:formylglycine-generating enzyme required for sulfatase activity
VFTPNGASLSAEITDAKNVTMRLVPAGDFSMGSNSPIDNEKPVHTVSVGNFYMDVYEVTNQLYKACVEAGKCTEPLHTTKLYSKSYANYPVVYVNWEQAQTYCEWRGGRLPSEAEWEKAAGWQVSANGKGQALPFPWGPNPDCDHANYLGRTDQTGKPIGCRDTVIQVGSFVRGRSPYGLYDMAGNVSEWVADWYDAYPGSTYINQDFGLTHRVLRGGDLTNSDAKIRVTSRTGEAPTAQLYNVGFRCAR